MERNGAISLLLVSSLFLALAAPAESTAVGECTNIISWSGCFDLTCSFNCLWKGKGIRGYCAPSPRGGKHAKGCVCVYACGSNRDSSPDSNPDSSLDSDP